MSLCRITTITTDIADTVRKDGVCSSSTHAMQVKNFTRCLNDFTAVHGRNLSFDLLTTAFNKLQLSYEKLENAQDEYVMAADDGNEIVDYLDDASGKYQTALIQYGEYQQKSIAEERTHLQTQAEENRRAEDDRRAKEVEDIKVADDAKMKAEKEALFDTASAEFNSGIQVFVRKNESIRGVVAEASDVDKRDAFEKLEIDFESLRGKLVTLGGISKDVDITEYRDDFVEQVEKPFLSTQKWFLSQLKNSTTTPLQLSRSSALPSSSSSSSSSASNTKKEPVKLPSFKGDLTSSPSPYVMYPSWRSRWDLLIAEFESKFRINFLLERLDDAALEKVIGYEQDYVGALKRLDSFYGDPLKVVSCIMSEVNSPSVICEGDYRALISYSGVLEQNYNRLSCMDLDHEMSNTSSMTMIVRKFPNAVAEKWAEHIVAQDNAAKAKPFPVFIKWLLSQREIWERMAAVEATKGEGEAQTYFAGGGGARPRDPKEIECYRCGERGHRRSECPQVKKKDQKKPRAKPKYKKFWCAFHKEDPLKNCSSISCQDLRKADPATRVQLVKANKDCIHCCGDHDSVTCNKKDRICGGGQVNRGCSQKHAGHELFCLSAKVFTIHSVFHQQGGRRVEGVLLLISLIRSCRKNDWVTVFWDLGSTSNFVREAYAKKMKFKCRQKRLCVTTLTGTVTDYTVNTYSCSIQDKR